ncbi:LON peptidase substrate-binding domain-containing protein [Mycolicibacillus parakoreensis]|uniref:LON peptidase substrate-binding domain-containing protein n=2 Tax=Mycolicibacillus parakoreensis TaxID=1069221 RepID=A0ABY3U1E6_9MYCO|nr:LON peptidase substrate-binding domain-containing protein [Mycolicibacillus parakoreensis]MCV7315958.1 LON peptidase substrate-binding domain-containing protein [Mycolicibacillus parakoreensis]ULN52410.1 LON peptidase substrate-binding domain-containing protein [Mycolicibacillus parakoreensis]HLR98952.1 LON peptidase substrate-binding domain-containing protein [Mycolicibacillus parakoreensis]
MAPLPMFPLESVLLPGETLPLRIFEPRYRELVSDALAGDRRFGVVLIAAGREVGGGERRCEVGALATITEHRRLGFGQHALVCAVGERLRVVRWLDDDPYPRAETRPWPDEPDEPGEAVGDSEIRVLEDRLLALYQRVSTRRRLALPARDALFGPPGEPAGERLYNLAARIPIGPADRYAVLAAPSVAARLAAVDDAIDTVAARVAFQLAE